MRCIRHLYFSQRPPGLQLLHSNGPSSTTEAAGGTAQRRRSPGGAALEQLERQLTAEARDGRAFQSRLLRAVSGRRHWPFITVINHHRHVISVHRLAVGAAPSCQLLICL